MSDIEIEKTDIKSLLQFFAQNTFKAKDCDPICTSIMKKCIELVEIDYDYTIVNNTYGELSANYPSQLIIMENEKFERLEKNSESSKSLKNGFIFESVTDANKLKELINKAKIARCRARFPLPVILYNGKHVCRSSTLASTAEVYARLGLNFLFSGEDVSVTTEEYSDEDLPQGFWRLFNKARKMDIRLLKALKVGTIIDFMVEKKKVKFGVNVTSSEKVDKENRYEQFTILALPYPGCEFFKAYRDNNYFAEGLIFDWSQNHVDSSIGIPDDKVTSQLQVNWNNYKDWDLPELTKNYMLLLLKYLTDNPDGLLIHCISGWDRTPLFISLLRLSLWADGVAHKSLSPIQILYFTVAYDWMFFGHNLNDRVSKGEDILYFCFYFLKYLEREEFSIRHKTKNNSVLSVDNETQIGDNAQDLGMLSDVETHVSSQGSNISLNSSWSSISSKSLDNPPNYFFADEQGNSQCYPMVEINNSSSMINNSHYSHISAISKSHYSSNSNSPKYSDISNNSEIKNAQQDFECSNNFQKSYNGTNYKSHTRTSPVAVPENPTGFRQRNESISSTGSWQIITGTGSLRSVNSSCGSNNSQNSRFTIHDSNLLGHSSNTIVEDDFVVASSSSDNSKRSSTSRAERLNCVRELFSKCYGADVGFKFKDGSDCSSFGSIFGNILPNIMAQKTNV